MESLTVYYDGNNMSIGTDIFKGDGMLISTPSGSFTTTIEEITALYKKEYANKSAVRAPQLLDDSELGADIN